MSELTLALDAHKKLREENEELNKINDQLEKLNNKNFKEKKVLQQSRNELLNVANYLYDGTGEHPRNKSIWSVIKKAQALKDKE